MKINDKVLEITKKFLGIILIIGGIFGLFLPFFQGIAMIILGAILFGNKFLIRKIKQIKKYF